MSRHNSRVLAFQALYSWDVSQSSLEDLLTFSWVQKEAAADAEDSAEAPAEASVHLDEDVKVFAGLVISGTIEHIAEIDELIKTHLSDKWTLERINKVTLAILRTSIYEIKYMAGSTQNIVIDEAVTIAKKYGADDAYKFINAILDKISKEQ